MSDVLGLVGREGSIGVDAEALGRLFAERLGESPSSPESGDRSGHGTSAIMLDRGRRVKLTIEDVAVARGSTSTTFAG